MILRADSLYEVGGNLFFGYVIVLAFSLEDGGACIRRTLGIDGEIILRAAVGVAAQGLKQLESRLADDLDKSLVIAERRSGKSARELGDTRDNYLLEVIHVDAPDLMLVFAAEIVKQRRPRISLNEDYRRHFVLREDRHGQYAQQHNSTEKR